MRYGALSKTGSTLDQMGPLNTVKCSPCPSTPMVTRDAECTPRPAVIKAVHRFAHKSPIHTPLFGHALLQTHDRLTMGSATGSGHSDEVCHVLQGAETAPSAFVKQDLDEIKSPSAAAVAAADAEHADFKAKPPMVRVKHCTVHSMAPSHKMGFLGRCKEPDLCCCTFHNLALLPCRCQMRQRSQEHMCRRPLMPLLVWTSASTSALMRSVIM